MRPKNMLAIIGAACRLPGAETLDQFWDNLLHGRDSLSPLGNDRWSYRLYGHPDPAQRGKTYAPRAGLLTEIDRFDAGFFGMSPREAAEIDPQQRIMLEVAWRTIEDAGLGGRKINGSDTAVFVAASGTDYANLRLTDPSGADAYFMPGNTLSIISNRLSYVFDLHGPSLTVDTACSSSLVALHLACEALRDGKADMALVGGINLLLSPYPFIGFSRASMLSAKGSCFAFDHRADGYVRAEGAGAVLLKPLDAALADGDRVRGVILNTGVNSDGRTVGLSFPNTHAQAALLQEVYGDIGLDPADLSFFEAHGTGTPAGDPVEAGAIGRILGQKRTAPLAIGSVKTNIGHLESASGIAGLLKVMLALEKGVIPPSINLEKPNPSIDWEGLNLRVNTELTPLDPALPRIAGVNSFGFGGTNGHVVMAAPPSRPTPAQDETTPSGQQNLPPLIISARSETALKSLAKSWQDRLILADESELPSLLRAAAKRRERAANRLVVNADGKTALVEALGDFTAGVETTAAINHLASDDHRIAFVFSGNGAQYVGMAQEAIATSAQFRAALLRVDAQFRPYLSWSIVDQLSKPDDDGSLAHTDIAQPTLFAIQVALVETLALNGVTGDAFFGHSVGEIAAAWAAGGLTLDEACRTIAARSANQEKTKGTGRMAVLAMPADQAEPFIAKIDPALTIAGYNSADGLTIAGPGHAIAALGVRAQAQSVRFKELDLDYAFHCALMDPVKETTLTDLVGLNPTPPCRPFFSTVTGMRHVTPLDGTYWWRNIREPVRFAAAVDGLIEEGFRIFLEIGPNPILLAYIRDGLRSRNSHGHALATLSKRLPNGNPFPRIIADLEAAGADFSEGPLYAGPVAFDDLPVHPFADERHWYKHTTETTDLINPLYDHPLLGFRRDTSVTTWFNHVDLTRYGWLGDHAVQGGALLPAAGFIDIALAAARALFPEASSLQIDDLELRRAMNLPKDRTLEIRTSVVGTGHEVQIASRTRLSDESWTIHATARVAKGWRLAHGGPALPKIGGITLDPVQFYRDVERLGFTYGPHFQPLTTIAVLGPTEAVVHFTDDALPLEPEAWLMHPALVDGALQGLLALLLRHPDLPPGISFLPWRFGSIRLVDKAAGRPVAAALTLHHLGRRSVRAAIHLFNANHQPIAIFNDCWFQRVDVAQHHGPESELFTVERIAAPLSGISAPPAALSFDLDAWQAQFIALEDKKPAEVGALLNGFIASSTYRLFDRLCDGQGVIAVADLVGAGKLHPSASAFLNGLLLHLEQGGLAHRDQGRWVLDPADLPDPNEIWRLMMADYPDLVTELALVGEAVAALAHSLANGTDAAPQWNDVLIDEFLHGGPVGRRAVEAIADQVRTIVSTWPVDRPLRILEIGARSGAVMRAVTRALREDQGRFTYLVTDPSEKSVDRLAAEALSLEGVDAALWHPGTGDLGAEAGPFDLILSVQAFTRCGLDRTALKRLETLSAPGGRLLAIEPMPNAAWDLVFGATAGWWHDSAEAHLPVSAQLNAGELERFLAEAGFTDPCLAPFTDAPWPTDLITATIPVSRRTAECHPAKLLTNRLLLGQEGALAAALVAGLAEPGVTVRLIPTPEQLDRHIVDGDTDLIILPFADERALAAHLGLIAATVRALGERSVRLWLITRDAGHPDPARFTDATPIQAAAGAVIGFARSIANEHHGYQIRTLDLSHGLDPAQIPAIVAAELSAAGAEREIHWTKLGRFVPRVRRYLAPPSAPTDQKTPGTKLDILHPGRLDSLTWVPFTPVEPGPDQVALSVKASALNFRDVMWAMGLLPEEALIDGYAGPTLGLECAGIITAVGRNVRHFAVGDRVSAFAPAALASHVVTDATCVTRLPDAISFAAGATIPVAFITVVYSLGWMGRLSVGETVLIHGGAGGVGLAAIQYAQYIGAKIIATVGSSVKRAFLERLGIQHILDSRSLTFVDDVRAITGGAGVDVVLNSLGGDAMERSIGLLKPFGRFIELGKRDFYQNTRIGLRPLRENIAYFAIDVDRLPRVAPDQTNKLLAEVGDLLQRGALRPLPHLTYRFSAVTETFRILQASDHLGKIVLVPDQNQTALTAYRPAYRADAEGVYVISGGMGGFGLVTVQWLIAQGARRLALLGRTIAPSVEADAVFARAKQQGAHIELYRCDVGDADRLEQVLSAIRRDLGPICGVIHAAAALDDGLVRDMTAERCATALHAKLFGALNLDRLTRQDPVSLFLLYSSATTGLGAPGQSSYVAANLGLETLADARRQAGLPAQVIGWGPIADVGLLARDPAMRDALARRLGATPVPALRALDSVAPFLAEPSLNVMSAAVDWTRALASLPIAQSGLYAAVRARSTDPVHHGDLRDRLAAADAQEAASLLLDLLRHELARIFRLAPDRIDARKSMAQFGMDSLMAVELQLALESQLGISLPLMILSDGASLNVVVQRILPMIQGTGEQRSSVATVLERYEPGT